MVGVYGRMASSLPLAAAGALVEQGYFTCMQLHSVALAFKDPSAGAEAVVRVGADRAQRRKGAETHIFKFELVMITYDERSQLSGASPSPPPQVFAVLTDPENLGRQVLRALGPHATAAVRSTLAPLLHYHPANPTGVYTLMLGQRAHRAVAKRLLLAFTQQWDAGFSTHPYRMAFTTCTVDGKVGGWLGKRAVGRLWLPPMPNGT